VSDINGGTRYGQSVYTSGGTRPRASYQPGNTRRDRVYATNRVPEWYMEKGTGVPPPSQSVGAGPQPKPVGAGPQPKPVEGVSGPKARGRCLRP